MTRKTHTISIVLCVAALSALILLASLGADSWLDAGPIVDLRL